MGGERGGWGRLELFFAHAAAGGGASPSLFRRARRPERSNDTRRDTLVPAGAGPPGARARARRAGAARPVASRSLGPWALPPSRIRGRPRPPAPPHPAAGLPRAQTSKHHHRTQLGWMAGTLGRAARPPRRAIESRRRRRAGGEAGPTALRPRPRPAPGAARPGSGAKPRQDSASCSQLPSLAVWGPRQLPPANARPGWRPQNALGRRSQGGAEHSPVLPAPPLRLCTPTAAGSGGRPRPPPGSTHVRIYSATWLAQGVFAVYKQKNARMEREGRASFFLLARSPALPTCFFVPQVASPQPHPFFFSAPAMQVSSGQDGIQRLLAAEAEAQTVVAKARKGAGKKRRGGRARVFSFLFRCPGKRVCAPGGGGHGRGATRLHAPRVHGGLP